MLFRQIMRSHLHDLSFLLVSFTEYAFFSNAVIKSDAIWENYLRKDKERMDKDPVENFFFFLIGLLVGGCVAFVVLCCLQINRINALESEIRRLRSQYSGEY